MASVEDADGQKSLQNTLVDCCSKRMVKNVSTIVNETISTIARNSISWTEEEQERCKERFMQIYESTLQENVSIDGQPWTKQEIEERTTEFEPVNQERKKYLDDVLLPQLDNAMVTVTRKRKRCPHQCAWQLAKLSRFEHKFLDYVEVQVPSKVNSTRKDSTKVKSLETLTKNNIISVAKEVKEQMESMATLADEADHQKQALQMHAVIGRTETDKILFPSQSVEGKGSETHGLLHGRHRLNAPHVANTSLSKNHWLKTQWTLPKKGYLLRKKEPKR